MKALHRWLLYTGIVLAGIYGASPFWMPSLLESQLPPGWELEELDIDYPGINGININTLRLKGSVLASGVELLAKQTQFDYQIRKIEINSLSVDVSLSADTSANESFRLDYLHLPLIQIPANLKLPEILVHQLQLTLYPVSDTAATDQLVMNYDGFELKPSRQHDYHLITGISLAGYANVEGQLEVEVSEVLFAANLHLLDGRSSAPWLEASLEQKTQSLLNQSEIIVKLDAALIKQERLDGLAKQISAGWLHHLEGKLILQAGFSGENQQQIKQLSFVTNKLRLETEGETLQLDVELLAANESGNILITQGKTADILYQGRGDGGLVSHIIPALKHQDDMDAEIQIRVNKLQLETDAGFSQEQLKGSSLLELHWQEKSAFVYRSEDLIVQAGSMEVEVIGELSIHRQEISFEHLGDLELQLNKLQLVGLADDSRINITTETSHTSASLDFAYSLQHTDAPLDFNFTGKLDLTQAMIELTEGAAPQLVVTAKAMPVSVKFSNHADQLLSSGTASLTTASISLFNQGIESINADKLDLHWQQLDLLKLTGKLDTRTRGLVLNIDGEPWLGFDLDLRNRLDTDGKITGSGKVLFDADTEVAIDYRGSLENGRWQLKVPAADIEVSRLHTLMAIAHIELPKTLKLADGSIQLTADINIAGEINGTALLKGKGIGFSILENTVDGGSFEMHALLGRELKLNGSLTVADLDVAGGINVRNIRVQLATEGIDAVQADKLQAELFGGRLEPANLHYLNSSIEDSILKLKGIDLRRLLVFADVDGLEGTGKLDISLPIGSDAGGLFVRNASFSSSSPGNLVYLSGAGVGNIGLQALENFQYQDLSGTLDYQSDGNYQVFISLNGSNPDLYDDHPVSFNLTIGGLLPQLFEALFVTGSFEDGIIKQIRSK